MNARATTPLIRIFLVMMLVAPLSAARADIQSADLDFSSAGQSMWGSGAGFNLDRTWTDFIATFNSGGTQTIDTTVLGSGFTVDYSYSGRVGLEPRLRISAGNVDVNYPIRVDASLPNTVQRNGTFSINTASWSHLASQISTTGPGARFTLDAILEFDGTVGPGSISAAGVNVADIPSVNLPLNYRKTIVDIGSGSSNIEFPAGPYGTVTIGVPDILELNSSTLIPPELAKLQATGQDANPFLNLGVDLDAVAVTLFGLPPNLLGDNYTILGDNVDVNGTPDLFLEYELLNVQANLGLVFAQQLTFIPTSIGVTMTSEMGEVRTGLLGDTFTFTAPNQNGVFDVDAEYTLNGQLRSQTGFVANGSLQVQAGKFVLHNEIGPDFEVNLASLVSGGNYLYDQQFPDGGLNIGPPLYVFDSTFGLGGFEAASAAYNIQVIPESSSWALMGVTLTSLLLANRRWKKR